MIWTREPRVFVIVLNWNGWRDTIECLKSLRQSSYPNFRVVVVDNGSSDGSLTRIKAWAKGEGSAGPDQEHREGDGGSGIVLYSRDEAESGGTEAGEATLRDAPPGYGLVLIRAGTNLGFAGGCNIGIRYALKREAEYIWLLNNDTVVDSRAFTEMVALARPAERVGIVGSVLSYYHDPRVIQAYGGGSINWWWGTTRHLKERKGLAYLSGASLLIKRPVIESVGLLDERYFFYWEDVDYSRRALKAGWRMEVADGSCIFHKEGGTVSGEGRVKTFASDYFMVRGMILFFSSHGGARWPLAVLMRLSGMVMNRLRRRQGDRILPLLKVAGATCWEVAAARVARLFPRRAVKRVL